MNQGVADPCLTTWLLRLIVSTYSLYQISMICQDVKLQNYENGNYKIAASIIIRIAYQMSNIAVLFFNRLSGPNILQSADFQAADCDFIDLKSQIIIYQNHFYPFRDLRESGNQKLTAYGIWRLTVKACPRPGARRIQSESLCIDRSGFIPCPGHRVFYIFNNFIHADDHHHVSWTIGNRRHAVPDSVDIHDHPVFCDRIGAGQKIIAVIGNQFNLPLLLRRPG